jgi:hypothetical protein
MLGVITIPGTSSNPRLAPEEIEDFFRIAYAVHDHEARTPAEPIFWYRTEGDLHYDRFWN